eukprot:m.681645 g.681645  ORF g.681645 m.681645 type:complete len:337 (+) comp58600_c1_seq1:211-1221(+)
MCSYNSLAVSVEAEGLIGPIPESKGRLLFTAASQLHQDVSQQAAGFLVAHICAAEGSNIDSVPKLTAGIQYLNSHLTDATSEALAAASGVGVTTTAADITATLRAIFEKKAGEVAGYGRSGVGRLIKDVRLAHPFADGDLLKTVCETEFEAFLATHQSVAQEADSGKKSKKAAPAAATTTATTETTESAAAAAPATEAAPAEEPKQIVTPFEVIADKGVNYDRLIEDFGTERVTADHVARIQKLTGKPAHRFLRRSVRHEIRDVWFSRRCWPSVLFFALLFVRLIVELCELSDCGAVAFSSRTETLVTFWTRLRRARASTCTQAVDPAQTPCILAT